MLKQWKTNSKKTLTTSKRRPNKIESVDGKDFVNIILTDFFLKKKQN